MCSLTEVTPSFLVSERLSLSDMPPEMQSKIIFTFKFSLCMCSFDENKIAHEGAKLTKVLPHKRKQLEVRLGNQSLH